MNKHFLTIKHLLKEGLKEIESSEQWNEKPYIVAWKQNSLKDLIKAESILELIEVYNCGSIGGFGKNQTPQMNVKERLEAFASVYL